jgi:signal peptidase II
MSRIGSCWIAWIAPPVTEAPAGSRRFALQFGAARWLWLTLLVLVLDQWSKKLILDTMIEYQEIFVLPVLDIVRWHNEGAAWSLLSQASGWQRWFFVALGIAVSLGILVWLCQLPRRGQARVAAGLALVMGGAIGNVIDRLYLGYVVDFIKVHYHEWVFPAFNLADSAITIGAALLILDSLIEFGKRSDRGRGS